MPQHQHIRITLTANAQPPRRETVGGEECWVVPFTSVRQGILNGSRGRGFYPDDETRKRVDGWNGMPVTMGHPTRNGTHVSAAEPTIRERFAIGQIRNSIFDRALRGEAVISVAKCRDADARFGTDVANRIERGEALEISTGLVLEADPTPGTWNGQPYDWVARNHRPDHLAILPRQRGACSVRDGCGLNVNEGNVENEYVVCEQTGPHCECESGSEACEECKKKMDGMLGSSDAMQMITTKVENSFFSRFWSWLTNAAGKYGNPQSTATGKFKPRGSGTGRGDDHEAAQRSFAVAVLSDRDRQRGASARSEFEAFGANPASWVTDEDIWNRAKAAADKGDYDDDTYWAVVAHIYERMGGGIKEQVGNENAELITNSNGGSEMDRTQAIGWLVANCAEWKGKDKLLANKDAFSDDEVKALVKNAEKLKADVAERDALLTANKALLDAAKALGAPASMTVNEMPAFIKEKMDAKKGSGDKDEDKDEKKEEEVENRLKELIKNQLSGLSAKDWLGLAPAEVREGVANAMTVVADEQSRLIGAITANVADGEAKSRIIANLRGKPLVELRDLALVVARPADDRVFNRGGAGDAGDPLRAAPLSIFLPQSGAPVGNAAGKLSDDDLYITPVMNFDAARAGKSKLPA